MKKTVTILILFFTFTGYIFAQTGAIKGTVYDENGDPLPYANVFVEVGGYLQGTATNLSGNFVIKPLSAGYYNLTVKFIGYDSVIVNNIYVDGDADKFVNDIHMGVQTITGVTIYADEGRLIDPDDPGRLKLKRTALAKTPGAGNLMNIIATLPGISVDNNNNMVIRGARSSANCIFIDGVKVNDLNSGIPKSSYGSVSVYTGGIPAKYGDVTGGVIIVESMGFFDVYNMRKAKRSR